MENAANQNPFPPVKKKKYLQTPPLLPLSVSLSLQLFPH